MLEGLEAVRVFVTDVSKSVSFYRDTLGLDPIFVEDDAAMFNTGQTKLIIERGDPNDPEEAAYIGRFSGISFRVTNMDKAYHELRDRGVRFDGAPETQAWGGVLGHFFDPDDNVLTLVADQPANTT